MPGRYQISVRNTLLKTNKEKLPDHKLQFEEDLILNTNTVHPIQHCLRIQGGCYTTVDFVTAASQNGVTVVLI